MFYAVRQRVLLRIVYSYLLMNNIIGVLGIYSCSSCTETEGCILDGSTVIGPGAASIQLTLCKWEATRVGNILFSAERTPSCDPMGLSLPVQESMVILSCVSDGACNVRILLSAPMDSALVVRTDSSLPYNVLRASINNQDAVPVAILDDTAETSIVEAERLTSLCASTFTITTTTLFSRIEACNTASVCLASSSGACQSTLDTNVPVTNAACYSSQCTADVALPTTFPCSTLESPNRFLAVQLHINGAVVVSPTKAVKFEATTPEITSVAIAGTLVQITGNHLCATPNGQVNFLSANTSDAQTGTFQESSTSSSVLVSLETVLALGEATVTYNVCSLSTTFTATNDGSTDGIQEVVTPAPANDAGPLADPVEGSQDSGGTALPGGALVGIGIGVLALVGLAVEFRMSRVRYDEANIVLQDTELL